MAKKKKKSEVHPLLFLVGKPVAWHLLKKDGTVGVEMSPSFSPPDSIYEMYQDWLQVPAKAGVRAPIAWLRGIKAGGILDIEVADLPVYGASMPAEVEIVAEMAEDDSDWETVENYDGKELSKEGITAPSGRSSPPRARAPSPSPPTDDNTRPRIYTSDRVFAPEQLKLFYTHGKDVVAPNATVTVGEEEVVTPKAPSSHAIPTNLDQEGKGISAPRPMSYANVVKSFGTGPPPRIHAASAYTKKSFMNSGLGGRLSFSPPTTDHVEIKVAEALPMETVWGWALLGQYVGLQPGHHKIMEMIRSWGVKAIYRIEAGWMIFSYQSEIDRDNVLLGGPYFIQGRPMMLKNIPDKFSFNRRDVAYTPLWVRIIGFSKTFWTPEVLGRIASHVGKPLFMDPVTDSRKRGSYARVLVEVNLAAPVKRGVRLHFDDGEVLECSFLLENEPLFCRECCSLGHKIDGCPLKVKKASVGANTNKSSLAVKDGIVPAVFTSIGTGMESPAPPTNATIIAPSPPQVATGSPKETRHQPGLNQGKEDTVSPSDMARIVDEETVVEKPRSKCLEHNEEEVNEDACDSYGQNKDGEEDTSVSSKNKYKSKEKMFSSGASDMVIAPRPPDKPSPQPRTLRSTTKRSR